MHYANSPGNALASPGRLDGELIALVPGRVVKALDGAIKAYEKPSEKSWGLTAIKLYFR